MNSLCIKTNNNDILEYLKNEFIEFNMSDIYFSTNEFKLYKNIIIHYKGNDIELFYTKLASILSYLVIDYFENDMIKKIIHSNYFYFDNNECSDIINFCNENLSDNCDFSLKNRELILFDIFYNYISTHNSIILCGFINFRLYLYKNLLENLVDLSVNEFIIEKEYYEFISLLKIYINTQKCLTNNIHIISLDYETFLLDENLNIIDIDENSLNAKYLSDISFSKNDYILNTILKILPKKIYLHQISPYSNLEFINTLKLIYDKKILICNDCNICNMYKNLNINHKK